jgi:hypothetical protein
MKITRRQLRKLINESTGKAPIEDLLKILRPLKSKEQSNYALFASLVLYTISEDTQLGEQLGVISIEEFETDAYAEEGYSPDITIKLRDSAAVKNFVDILESAGLDQYENNHYSTSKGLPKFKGHPKLHHKSFPSVTFWSDDYNKDMPEIQ